VRKIQARGTRMTIDRAGYPFIAVAFVPAVACLAAGLPILALPLTGLAVGIALFFRDPERFTPQAPEVVVSPADGRVLYVGAADRTLAPPGDWLQISIFLSPLDVHVNRVPIAGRVTRIEHVPGTFLPAYRSGAASRNERTEIWLEHAGQTIVFRQVVGALARRVVCRLALGASVQTGQRFGIMKFGSRMDLFMATTATLVVTKRDRVRAGETIVARLGEDVNAP
jgi:phosphatidylserine decarboxylase